ncbi:MAG TPA: hypothetical protein VF147_00810 [Vicinamibacterales bacterium]
MYQQRLLRAKVLEALDARVKQFRSREDTYPFRVPHEPLPLHELIDEALAGEAGRVGEDDIRSRYVISLHWHDGATWAAWVTTLPSGIHLFCDSDAHETRVLASLKRGSSVEADHFFLELLAESRGHAFGIEMAAGVPDRVRTSITDRAFLADVFVEMYEGTPEQAVIHAAERVSTSEVDFRGDVALWLDRVLVAPQPSGPRRRVRRLREDD